MVSWDNAIDRAVVGRDLLYEMERNMVKIRHNLKVSQDRKKICIDKGRTHQYFKVDDHVFLKVKSKHNSLKLGNCSKLASCYCGQFQILEKIGPIPYMLAFPASLCIHNVFHVSFLKKYVPDDNHITYWNVIQVDP
jgi:hypothetical protein